MLPEGVEELVLWQDEDKEREEAKSSLPAVKVDNMLTRWLRPHQREGVSFLYECVMGLRGFEGAGCILADDMGLGKTLQAIALMWTLLNTSIEEDQKPTVKKVVIVCPTSLVANWDAECIKWLKGKVKTTPICGDSRADAESAVKMFLAPQSRSQVLIVSYETFRIYHERFTTESSCQLVICDEAHRLKNGETLTNQALAKMACKRRIMLSGTPMQNHLDEFYSMVSFCNPGILGTTKEFAKKYERPILAGREPYATDAELAKANERNEMLSVIVNKFILRRTNTILSKHLPPKVIEIVCCKTTPLQRSIYEHLLSEKARIAQKTGKQMDVLACITALKKLCNHPKLIYDMINGAKNTGQAASGFSTCAEFFTPGMYDGGGGRSGRGGGGMMHGWEEHSGKFAVLARLLANLRAETKDRIVIISNYTQTLDLVGNMCRERNYPFVRLDGSTSIGKRQKLVKQFNDPTSNSFVFLLSSKAGGCGINLIGGNRLVLFDPDWNPANDKQAAARCWRDGQKKKCYLYRFLAAGTIEEKVFQRQLSKESLQNVVNGSGELEQSVMSKDELRKLFSLDCTTYSDTHDTCGCKRCPARNGDDLGCDPDAEYKEWEEQIDDADEQKLDEWAHHHRMDKVPDDMMKKSAGEDVSFVFSLKVEGAAIDESKKAPAPEKKSEEASEKKPTPTMPSHSTRPPTRFVPPARRPLAPRVAPQATAMPAYQRPSTLIAAKPSEGRMPPMRAAVKPAAKAPKKKKKLESESEDEDTEEESEQEESEAEEESEEDEPVADTEGDDDDEVPDSEDEDVADTSAPRQKRSSPDADESATRYKAARLSSLTSDRGFAVPPRSPSDESDGY